MIMSEKEEFITLHKKKGYTVEDYGGDGDSYTQ